MNRIGWIVMLCLVTGASVADEIHCHVNSLSQEVCMNRTTGERTVTTVDTLGQEVTKRNGRTIQTCRIDSFGDKRCR